MRVDLQPPLPQRVGRALRDCPQARDSDSILVSMLWSEEIPPDITFREFVEMMSNGMVTHCESISRMRRKLQELDPDLRGDMFEPRHAYTHAIKKQLRDTGQMSFDFD